MDTYRKWLIKIKANPSVEIIDINDWLKNPVRKENKTMVLIRHDVDINLTRTLNMIHLEEKLNIPSCYYFRTHAERFTFNEAKIVMNVIKEIEFIEIGFHYETLSNTSGNAEIAKERFKKEVKQFRNYYPKLKMISAHGDKFRNRQLVKKNIVNIDELGLISSYDLGHDLYFSEIGGKHHQRVNNKKNRFFDSMKIFDNPPLGKLIQILIHADWWF